MSEAAVADTRRLNSKPQDLTDAYGPPSNFLEIDIFNPQTVGVGRARYTSYELRMRVRGAGPHGGGAAKWAVGVGGSGNLPGPLPCRGASALAQLVDGPGDCRAAPRGRAPARIPTVGEGLEALGARWEPLPVCLQQGGELLLQGTVNGALPSQSASGEGQEGPPPSTGSSFCPDKPAHLQIERVLREAAI